MIKQLHIHVPTKVYTLIKLKIGVKLSEYTHSQKCNMLKMQIMQKKFRIILANNLQAGIMENKLCLKVFSF